MQRIKKNINNPNNIKLKEVSYNIKNFIPNGHTNKIINITPILDNKISKGSNKLLSVLENRNEIEDNNFSQILVESKSKENKKLLYIKKTKSDANINNIKPKNSNIMNRNKNIFDRNYIRFSQNQTLINKTIQEYYKEDNFFKNYLKTMNNESKDSQKKKIKKIINISPFPKEIYKKPISNKIYNIINNKDKNIEENNNNNNNNINSILDNLCIPNSVRKEKINCAKMISNNGVKKNIFNIINNFNTTTIKNNDKIYRNKNKYNIYINN